MLILKMPNYKSIDCKYESTIDKIARIKKQKGINKVYFNGYSTPHPLSETQCNEKNLKNIRKI